MGNGSSLEAFCKEFLNEDSNSQLVQNEYDYKTICKCLREFVSDDKKVADYIEELPGPLVRKRA